MKKSVYTLHDIAEGSVPLRSGVGAATSSRNAQGGSKNSSQHYDTVNSNSNNSADPQCFHVPNLSQADHAKSLLERVLREFAPIIHRRGYNVKTVSEMCCCGDGLDQIRGKRRCSRMGSNVLGYNQTHRSSYGYQFHEIHLRLRHAARHACFFDYEDVAGTMAHELAHCVHGPHNDKFFKLMDEILEEHATLMASRMTTGNRRCTMPAFGGSGQALGGITTGSAATTTKKAGSGIPLNSRLLTGRTLGGEKTFAQWMTPTEAAVAAAEARRRQQQMRLRGSKGCCQPCVIEISDDEEEDEGAYGASQVSGGIIGIDTSIAKNDNTVVDSSNREPAATRILQGRSKAPNKNDVSEPRIIDDKSKKQQNYVAAASAKVSSMGPGCIDLTFSSDEEEDEQRKPSIQQAAKVKWSCRRCTYLNPPTVLTCGMCNESNHNKKARRHAEDP